MRALASFLAVASLLFAGAQADCYVPGLKGQYYGSYDPVATGPVLLTRFETPDFFWSFGSPDPSIPVDSFSVVWEGEITPPFTSTTYQFDGYTDDGFWLYFNDVELMSSPADRPAADTISPTVTMNVGEWYKIKFVYREHIEAATARLLWNANGGWTPIPISNLRATNCQTCTVSAPATVTIDSQTGGGTFDVVLTSQPNETVWVSLSTECAYLSNCSLFFTPDNWNVPQTVTLIEDPARPITSECQVQISGSEACSGNSTTKGSKGTSSSTSKQGTSWGDPHFVTYDDLHFNFYGVGDYVLTRDLSGDFVVLNRQVSCAGTVSCNFAVAVKYKSAIFYAYLTTAGVASYSTVGDLFKAGLTYQITSTSYVVTLPNSISVEIKTDYWSGGPTYYFNIYVTIPDSLNGKVRGLLGNADGDSSNDQVDRDGNPVSTDGFFASWTTSSTENLFEDKSSTFTPYPGAGSATLQLVPDPKCYSAPPPSPNHNEESPLKNKTVPVDPHRPDPGCTFTDPILEAEANAACNSPFVGPIPDCCRAAGISSESFRTTCLCDYHLSQGSDFVQSNIAPFFGKCMEIAPSCNACDDGCSGHGTCNLGVCNCDNGYKGDTCKEDWNTCQDVLELQPSSGNRCASQKVNVFGKNFYGDNIVCQVNGSPVATTKVSSNQVICTLPAPSSGTSSYSITVTRDGTPSCQAQTFTFVDSCCDNKCQNGASCTDKPGGGYTCQCTNDFNGPDCSTPACSLVAPATAVLSPSSGGGSAQISLSAQPTGNVQITFQSSCMAVSPCTMDFTPSDWSTPQTLNLIADARQSSATCDITVTATGDCVSSKKITVTRQTSKTRWGSSHGDPHFLTLDGKKYDFYGVGDYILSRDSLGEFVIQARQTKCGKASCNSAVAIKYKDAIFYAYIDNSQSATYSTVGDFAKNGVKITIEGSKYTFETPTGIKVGIYWFKKVRSTDFSVNMPLNYNVLGLLGNNDGNSNNDMMDRTGAVVSSTQFFQAWVAADSENLFMSPSATFEVLPGSAPPSRMDPDPQCSPSLSKRDSTGSSSPVPPSTEITNPVFEDPGCTFQDPTMEQEAIDACSAFFSSPEAACCAALGVSSQSSYETCLCDYKLSESPDFVPSSVGNFIGQCLQAIDNSGGSCNVCEDNCSGTGQCKNGVCTCLYGTSGSTCSIPGPDAPTVDLEIVTAPQSTAGTFGSISITFIGSQGSSGPHFLKKGFAKGSNVTISNIALNNWIGELYEIKLENTMKADRWKLSYIKISGGLNGMFGSGNVADVRYFHAPLVATIKTKETSNSETGSNVYITITDSNGARMTSVFPAGLDRGATVTQELPFFNLGKIASITLASFSIDAWSFDFIEISQKGQTFRFVDASGKGVSKYQTLRTFTPVGN